LKERKRFADNSCIAFGYRRWLDFAWRRRYLLYATAALLPATTASKRGIGTLLAARTIWHLCMFLRATCAFTFHASAILARFAAAPAALKFCDTWHCCRFLFALRKR